MKTNISVVQDIFKDHKAVQLVLGALAVCLVNFAFSWIGLLTLLVLTAAVSALIYLVQNNEARRKVQTSLTSCLNLEITHTSRPPDDAKEKFLVAKELDDAIESFFKKIVEIFINSWFSEVSSDESFVWNIKHEVAMAVRKIGERVDKVNHAEVIATRLLPVVYTHLDILNRLDNLHDHRKSISAFVENETPIHPATYSRNAELQYLRNLSKNLLKILIPSRNTDSKILVDLVKEVLACSVLLPMMDVICDPGTINLLVILATNPKSHKKMKKPSGKRVVLLENFEKKFKLNVDEGGSMEQLGGDFFKDQEKLYNFMQYLKSSNDDIDLLKFYLDVQHLNDELEKSSVISNPGRLSALQQQSEKLLNRYQTHLFKEENSPPPKDLLEAHTHAKQKLEDKWKNEFYRSAEYYSYIYPDRSHSHIPEAGWRRDSADSFASHQKFSSKIKNAMSIRPATVEGIEATEIPIWDALDHPLGGTSYYNSMAVKLRKERGQDLDAFMQTLFHSIEQEADVGEDVAANEGRDRPKKRLNQHGNELYKNLFNISRQLTSWQAGHEVKSPVGCLIHFLSEILKLNTSLVRICSGFLSLLPDADNILCQLLRKLLNRILNQAILAELIEVLEEKVFDSSPTIPPSQEELDQRHKLATERIQGLNKNLGKILIRLQNPVLNKHLMYCLMDLIVVEIFPELNLIAKD